jgi:hypothetical protein
MAEKTSIPLDLILVNSVDDLKLIRRIGPAIERRLHEAGIHTYSRLAEMSVESLAALLADMTGFSVQRLQQLDWIGQARQLADENKQKNMNIESELPERQHYALFSLELLLDEQNHVRRTRATNAQAQKEDAWAGWNLDRLAAFLAESAGIVFEMPQKEEPPAPIDADVVSESALVSGKPAGVLRVSEMHVSADEAENVQRLVLSHRPFNVTLKLDLSQAELRLNQPLDYLAIIYAKKMAGGSNHEIGRSEGRLKVTDCVDVEVPGIALPDGAYRIEAVVTLKLGANGENGRQNANLMAMMEGGLLQVY